MIEPQTPAVPSPHRRIAPRVIAVIVGAGSLNAFAQCLNFLPMFGNDPILLSLEQLVVGIAGGIAAFAAWRYRAWSWIATLVYGLLTGALIMSLPPLIDLDAQASAGLWAAALMIVVFCAGLALYLRYLTRPTTAQPTA